MRIVALNTYCGSGSTGRIAVEIAQYTAGQGSETVIGFGAGTVSPEAEVFALRLGSRLERKWHGAIRKLFDAEGYGSIRATRKLIAFLKTYRPDVVHLHNLHGCYLNHRLLFRYLRKANVPVLWTLHDCWPFTGHCAYFDYAHCDRWKTGCHHCPQKGSYPACVGPDGSRRNYRRRRALFTSLPKLMLVTPCAWLRDVVAQSFLRNAQIRVVYNGVDRARFRPTEGDVRTRYGIGNRKLVLAVASEWEARKGFAFLPPLQQALGDGYQVVVIGLSAAQVDALPSGMLGLTRTASTEELSQWYTAADCLVNPTLEDNMPLVNLEALACGTPVVAFQTGGCPEAVDETCGAIVPQGNAEALQQAVRRVCEARGTLREGCLHRALLMDSQRCAEAYYQLYQEVCP